MREKPLPSNQGAVDPWGGWIRVCWFQPEWARVPSSDPSAQGGGFAEGSSEGQPR